ncbi:MAG: hypothetical protein J6R36_04125, partial [Bacteroidaceae bacterium]|nr:hypothetical protein [Bacteroidaceae bacterium]
EYANTPLSCSTLTMLDISGNKLEGDLYDIIGYAPKLQTLLAGRNKIRDISGILPIYTLDYSAQDLRDIYTINSSELYNQDMNSDVPTIFTYYNMSNSTDSTNIDSYSTNYSVYISDAWRTDSKDYWYMGLANYLNSSNNVYRYSESSVIDGWYTKPSGQTLYGYSTEYGWANRHSFTVVMDYEMGDVNFDTQVNISDMQRSLNYALDSAYYSRYTPFNFHAANIINTDQTINVQDLVANINLVLDKEMAPALARGRNTLMLDSEENTQFEAAIYVKDGKLILSSARPVAAIDIMLTASGVKWASATDFFSKAKRGNRTILYSLFGDEIPAGETVLAEVDGEVVNAMLVDIDGNEVRLLIGEGDATSIDGVTTDAGANGPVYDLQGRKVSDRLDRKSLNKGVYITGGKKVRL